MTDKNKHNYLQLNSVIQMTLTESLEKMFSTQMRVESNFPSWELEYVGGSSQSRWKDKYYVLLLRMTKQQQVHASHHFLCWAHTSGSKKKPSQAPGSLIPQQLRLWLKLLPDPTTYFSSASTGPELTSVIFSLVLIIPVKVKTFYLERGYNTQGPYHS